MTVGQVQEAFLSQGYQVDAPLTWWADSHVTTFMEITPVPAAHAVDLDFLSALDHGIANL